MSLCFESKAKLKSINGISNTSLLMTEYKDHHDSVLDLTKKSAIPYIISSGINLISWSMMLSVFILYSRTFDNSSEDIISFVLASGLISSAIANFINSWLADIYGCDQILLIIWIVGSVALIICSITDDYIIFCIFYIIFEIFSGEMTIAQSYLAKMLPNNDCITYSGYISLTNILSWFAGPILSGIISYYISYQILYIVVACLRLITTLYVIMYIKIINPTQKEIEHDQLICIDYYKSSQGSDLDKSECFPICLERIKTQSIAYEEDETEVNNALLATISAENNLFLLICYLFEYGIVQSNEMQFINFYASYIHDKYNKNIVISTIQLAIGGSIGMLSTLIIPKIYNKYQNYFGYKIKNYFIIAFNIILIIFTIIILPQLGLFTLYWIILPIYLFISISLSMILYILIIETQKKSQSGKVFGVRSLINHLLGGIETLIIGLLWKIDQLNYNGLWYIQAAFYVLAILIFIMHSCYSYFQ